MINIVHGGIAHAVTNRKDDIFMQRRLYIDEAHMALDIFRFAVFFISFYPSLSDTLNYSNVLNAEAL